MSILRIPCFDLRDGESLTLYRDGGHLTLSVIAEDRTYSAAVCTAYAAGVLTLDEYEGKLSAGRRKHVRRECSIDETVEALRDLLREVRGNVASSMTSESSVNPDVDDALRQLVSEMRWPHRLSSGLPVNTAAMLRAAANEIGSRRTQSVQFTAPTDRYAEARLTSSLDELIRRAGLDQGWTLDAIDSLLASIEARLSERSSEQPDKPGRYKVILRPHGGAVTNTLEYVEVACRGDGKLAYLDPHETKAVWMPLDNPCVVSWGAQVE